MKKTLKLVQKLEQSLLIVIIVKKDDNLNGGICCMPMTPLYFDKNWGIFQDEHRFLVAHIVFLSVQVAKVYYITSNFIIQSYRMGKAGSCLPLVGSLQYRTLTNCMYWFPLPFQLPVVI